MKELLENRLLSLDVFRGMTIALMIIVNTIIVSPYHWLSHSEWHGCTLADLVFPFFLFVMGVAIVLSLSKYIEKNVHKHMLVYKIIRRSIIIFSLGLILNIFPHHMTLDSLATLRYFGVLQRIAVCFCGASLLYLFLSTSQQVILICVLLVGYWLSMVYVPVPEFGIANLTREGNLAGFIDRLLFGSQHLYGKIYDPEGLFSTLPALASTLLGCLTGTALKSRYTLLQKLGGLVGFGTLFLILGFAWSFWFPINKSLWTSSYVLWSTGLALYVFALCFWLLEIKKIESWSVPFKIFGLNALIAYFFHILLFKIQLLFHMICPNGNTCNIRNYIIHAGFGWASLPYASLYYALGSVLFWLLILSILYRHKIFVFV